jgi:hypothetical protein
MAKKISKNMERGLSKKNWVCFPKDTNYSVLFASMEVVQHFQWYYRATVGLSCEKSAEN